MYFLKKLTNFANTVNSNGIDVTVSSTMSSGEAHYGGKTDLINVILRDGIEKIEQDDRLEMDDSSSSPGSNLSIPDCFFDDVPETQSSNCVSSEEGQDTDSKEEEIIRTVPTDFGDDYIKENIAISSFSLSVNDAVHYPKVDKVNEVDFPDAECKDIGVTEEKTTESDLLIETKDTVSGQTFRARNVMENECEEDPMYSNTAEICINSSNALEFCASNNDWEDTIENQRCSWFDNNDDDANANNLDLQNDCYRRLSEISSIEDYLDGESDKAEARLAARRQARVEAREIRLRELERQQKEQEENADRAFDMSYVGDSLLRTGRGTPSTTALGARDRSTSTANTYHSSRRSSEDSIEEGLTLRDIRHELKEAEEKFKKAMIANAQLDNEKSALAYQVELLKDRFEDLEETHAQLTREHRDKCREHEQLKRAAVKLKEDLEYFKNNLLERDSLIAEYGLVIIDAEDDGEGKPKRTLVSVESAELLQQAGCGSLDVRLKKFTEERNELLDEIRHLKLELEEERSKRISDNKSGNGSLTNGPLDEETSKILSDYKFKLQKAEQDVSTLQANVARLESQVIRYKTAAESSEKAEDELKIEKRKLQRENRESIARIEELETANSHLQRRMDKLKNAKSTLLKEL